MTIQDDSRILWENLQTQIPADAIDKLDTTLGKILAKPARI